MKHHPRSRRAAARVGAGLLAMGLVVSFGPPMIGQAQDGYSSDEFNVARRGNEQILPRVSGSIVVWQDYSNLPPGTDLTKANADILGKDVDKDNDFKVTDNHTAAHPAISGDYVVYTDSRDAATSGLDIRGYKISSGGAFTPSDRAGDQDYPAIDGSLVVFQDHKGSDWDIRGYDIAKQNDFAVITRDGDQIKPAISGHIVVWEDYRGGANNPDIYYKNLDNDDVKAVTTNGDSRDPAISGDWIVYRTGDPNGDSQRVRAFNIKSGENLPLSDRVKLTGGPRISGPIVVWADKRNDEDFNIWGYNLDTKVQNIKIGTGNRDQTNPDISGTLVVWQDYRGDNAPDIRGARLTIPAAAAATPAQTTSASSGGPAPGPCRFVLGFDFLHGQLQGLDGNCTDNEHDDPNGTGDRVQGTFNPANNVTGYMVWQKKTNTMRWTDGFQTVTYSSCGSQKRLNTQSWRWEQNPSVIKDGFVPPEYCGLA